MYALDCPDSDPRLGDGVAEFRVIRYTVSRRLGKRSFSSSGSSSVLERRLVSREGTEASLLFYWLFACSFDLEDDPLPGFSFTCETIWDSSVSGEGGLDGYEVEIIFFVPVPVTPVPCKSVSGSRPRPESTPIILSGIRIPAAAA